MTLEKRFRWTIATLMTLLSACGGGGGGDAGSGGGPGFGAAVAAITISASATSINIGQTASFNAYPTDAQGNVLSGITFAWQTTNAGVATVADGLATGIAAGTAGITATAGGVTSNAVTLTVAAAAGTGAGTTAVPVNTARPAVAVTDRTTFLTLTASQGTWSNAPTSFSYGWTRNGVAIAGATQASYDTTAADLGAAVAAVVTASNTAGTASATSTAVSVAAAVVPTLGAHGLAFHRTQGSVGAALTVPAMSTQSGSTMLVFVGKSTLGNLTAPFDNKGNSPYTRIGTTHEYTRWRGQGTSAFSFLSIAGGTDHRVSVDDSNAFDEVTVGAVEVRNGGRIQDAQWNEVLDATTHTSASVTTTGPATLLAVWFGDDSSATPSNPVPNNGFTVIERQGASTETVAMFIATRDVSAAGTYSVTWAATPRQGAQLYLVAVQKP
jgi:hypothetical protein